MLKLFNKILDYGLTPNGYYLLATIRDNEDIRLNNTNLEIQNLISSGLLTTEGVTEKGEKVLCIIEDIKLKHTLSKEDIANIEKYREMFPKGNLPSGQPARSPVKELEKKFIWFFSNYYYSWDTVLEATKKYVEQYEAEGFMYMKTSNYFIYKTNPDKTGTSTLASFCDMILDIDDEDKDTKESYNGAI